MFWVYNNLYIYLNNNSNLFFKIFFFLNYFNIFLVNKNFKNLALNFNESNLNMKNNLSKKNTNLLLRYFNYFNKIIIKENNLLNSNQLVFYGKFKNTNLFYFNKFNYIFYKKLINLIFQINQENYNFTILDKSYKNVFPLYNYIFNFSSLLTYKKYFFIKTKFFTYNNWFYYYINFLKKFNIISIVILDFYYFDKFFKSLKNVNLPLISLIPINYANTVIDYPIYIHAYSNFEKFLLLNLVTQITLISFNYKNYVNKIKYLKLFYNFYTKLI